MRRRPFRSWASFLAACVLAAPARAQLIDRGTTTVDAGTNLEWLDVSATRGVSAQAIAVGGYGGLAADGWVHATVEQVQQLLLDAGLPLPHDGTQSAAGFAGAEVVLDLLGATGTTPSGAFIQAFSGTLVAPVPPFLRHTPVVVAFAPGIGGADLPGPTVPSSVSNPTIGNWLVRPVQAGPAEILVDVRPGSSANPVNPRSRGLIPVAVLTTEDFDATLDIDPLSARFGPAMVAPFRSRVRHVDVDGDMDLDLLLFFRTQDTGITCGDATALLVAASGDGSALAGSDAIVTVGCETLPPP